mgnify:CR=1 FL=1
MVQLYRQAYAEIILFYFLLFGLITASLYFNAYSVSLHILGPDWDLEMIVIGNSMSPTLVYGDSVCVRMGNSSTLTILPNSTIIAFQKPGSVMDVIDVITHRVIDSVPRNGQNYFRTKGDRNTAPDDWSDPRGEEYTWGGMVSDKLLIGKVMAVRKSGAIWQPLFVMATIVTSVTILSLIAVLSSTNKKIETHVNHKSNATLRK